MMMNLHYNTNKKKPKVLFYIQNLSGGGAERCVFEIFKYLDTSKFEYKLLLGKVDGEYLPYFDHSFLLDEKLTVSPNFSYISFLFYCDKVFSLLRFSLGRIIIKKLEKRMTKIWAENAIKKVNSLPNEMSNKSLLTRLINSERFWRLRNAIINYNPDLVVSSLIETGNAIVFSYQLCNPLLSRSFAWVAVEQNNTYDRFCQYYPDQNTLEFWHNFTKAIYAEPDYIIAVSEGIKKGLVKNYNVEANKVNIINNPVNISSINSVSPLTCKRPFILAAGRLHPQKGYDYLLKAYASIASSVDADLIILGEGKERNSLQSLAKELGIEETVYFPGFKNDLWSYMKSAQCFVLSSRYEGLGNVILEAMAANCPVVAFDCPYGPSEIIDHMSNGILVPAGDVDGLAQGIREVVMNKDLASDLAEAGKKRVQQFHSQKIAQQYEKVFESLS